MEVAHKENVGSVWQESVLGMATPQLEDETMDKLGRLNMHTIRCSVYATRFIVLFGEVRMIWGEGTQLQLRRPGCVRSGQLHYIAPLSFTMGTHFRLQAPQP